MGWSAPMRRAIPARTEVAGAGDGAAETVKLAREDVTFEGLIDVGVSRHEAGKSDPSECGLKIAIPVG